MRNIRFGTVCRLQVFPGYIENLVDFASGLPIAITSGMIIKAMVRRVSDGKVFRFDTNTWELLSNITSVLLENNIWATLTDIWTETAHVAPAQIIAYEYLWTFPENIVTTTEPEQYQIYYYNSGATYRLFKKEDIQYLPVSVTFDFFAVSPLESGSISVLGG